MPSIGLPLVEKTRRPSLYGLRLYPADRPESEKEKRFGRVETLQDMENHIEIVQGRVFSKNDQDDRILVFLDAESDCRPFSMLDFRRAWCPTEREWYYGTPQAYQAADTEAS